MLERYKVHESLEHYVDYYWEIKSSSAEESFLPDGSIHLVINLSEPVKVVNGKTMSLSEFCIFGPQQSILELFSNKECHLVGVKFKIGRFTNFFNVPAYNLTNQVYTPNSHYNTEVNYLREFMCVDNHIIGILAYFDRFLMRHLTKSMNPELLDNALEKINNGDYNLLIRDICSDIGVSNKHLIKIFKDNIGLPPKSLYRIKKFQKAVEEIKLDPHIDWSDLVYRCHYFDQAHLINEFKFFSGMTPTNYSKTVHSKMGLAC